MDHRDKLAIRRSLDRRAFLRLATLSGGAAILAACGGGAAAPTAAPAPTATTAVGTAPTAAPAAAAPTAAAVAPATAPAVVAPSGGQVMIEWDNGWTSAVTQEIVPPIIAEFEKLYPNIKVNYQNPGKSEGYTETLLSRIAAGSPPDVGTIASPPAELAARGSLLAIDDFMRSAQYAKPDAFFSAPLASCQWQGKTFGLPASAGTGAIYTNVDKFAAKKLPSGRDSFPKTWDELRALSKEFTVLEGGEVKEAGFVPFVGQAWLYPVWSALNGGVLYDVNSNSYKIDSEPNVQWLEYWLSWLDGEYGGNMEQLTVSGNWDDAYPESAFNQGRSAMVHTGSWVTTDAALPFAFDVARFPVGPGGSKSVTGFWPNWFIVPKGTKHPEEAFQFIEFFTTKGWEIWYTAILDTPAWKGFSPDVHNTKLTDITGKDKAAEFDKFFSDYLNDAAPMWNSPIEQFAQQTINTAVGEVLNKKKKVKDALAEAQQVCQTKLEQTLKG